MRIGRILVLVISLAVLVVIAGTLYRPSSPLHEVVGEWAERETPTGLIFRKDGTCAISAGSEKFPGHWKWLKPGRIGITYSPDGVPGSPEVIPIILDARRYHRLAGPFDVLTGNCGAWCTAEYHRVTP